MLKDARLIARIIGIWDPSSFLEIPRQTAFNESHDQKVPIHKPKRSYKPKHKGPGASKSAPPSGKAIQIRHSNSAKHMTGGKTNNKRKELAAKAANIVSR